MKEKEGDYMEIYLYDGDTRITEASAKHPNHAFNKGYIGSSSNETGFNTLLQTLIGQDLNTIFDPLEQPEVAEEEKEKWTEAEWFNYDHPIYPKEHLEKALRRIEKILNTLPSCPNYAVKTIETYGDAPPLTSQEAMKWALKENEQATHYNYETKVDATHGTYGWVGFHEPLKVVAIVPATLPEDLSDGAKEIFALLGHSTVTSGVHLVYEVEGLTDYLLTIVEICEEFIEKALTLCEPRIGVFY